MNGFERFERLRVDGRDESRMTERVLGRPNLDAVSNADIGGRP
jgi:hypothetical protein